jgi:predicted nucleotidyltransferase component of viral defense system
MLQFYVMERFLYRLSRSKYADRFVLKGALMLQVWESPQARPTMDIDMLGRTNNDLNALLVQIREIMDADPEVEDGLIFHGESLRAEVITEDAEYEGVRIRGWAELDRARARLQVDIGFGDAVVPEPQRQSYPVLLDQPTPELLCYSRESTIAEKFQAMVALGAINSRMKDFYDIWLLARQFSFEAAPLLRAMTATFERRDTQVPRESLFEDDFARQKQDQWRGFLRRLGNDVPSEPDFANVLALLEDFIGTVLAVDADEATALHWPASGPWDRRDRG